MTKLTKNSYILISGFVILALVGCAGKKKQTVATESQKPLTAAVEKQAEKTEPAVVEQAAPQKSQAQKKLEFAEHNLKMAQKGILGYSQTVAICRDIIKTYPGSEYETKARMLLRQIPTDQRSKYSITDEELGL